ncbi:MAG: FliM/FliN family flagellar motor switch protein [Alphaproteobacteria bacterium]|nr:FliM/FliN family flagellar motor switch protein [Alphaproteobacteria bacterium]
MKPQHSFAAERALARHCPELVRAAPGPDELIPLLERAGERLARTIAPAFAPLIGGKGLRIAAPAAGRTTCDALAQAHPALAANLLFGLGPDLLPLLVVIDAAAVLRMVDRTFGGQGDAPEPLPEAFPASAELLIRRLEALLVGALDAALFPDQPDALHPLRRHASLAELEPFPANEPLVALEFAVAEPGGKTWPLTLALPLPTLALGCGAAPRPGPARARQVADPLTAPFGDVPLELAAVLVDMRVSMAVLAALEPGTVLPVAVARAVPLLLGGLAVASGTVGAADDRIAIQITTAF